MVFKQALILLVVSIVFGLGVNLVSPNRVDYIGAYRDLSGSDGPIIPPDAAEGDPPFIDINVALLEFSSGSSLFVDSREPEEFECGTIPGSVNIPFEHLPEGDLGPYFDSALGYPSNNHSIIVYCSGEECDLSLHLARNLQAFGYSRASIFFGGSREWEKFGLDIERRKQCGE